MNILIITYKAEISGGSNRSLLSIIEILRNNNNITVFLPKKKGNMYSAIQNFDIKTMYMPFCRIGVKKSKYKLINFFRKIVLYLKLLHDYFYVIFKRSNLKKSNFDIVYTNGSAMHAGRYISRVLKIPHVWHIREFFYDDQIYPKKIYNIMENNTDKFILISRDMYLEYKKHISKDKLVMISNGIKYVECPKKEKHFGFNILLTGRITVLKCQLDALKALNLLVNNKLVDKDIKLFFAGKVVTGEDLEYKKILDEYINNNNLNKYVVFLGEVDNLLEIRKNMDVELMCSKREPFGRVTVEAMRSYLPVIGANSGGTKDIIINGYNGFLFDSENIEDLSNIIIKLKSNKDLLIKVSLNAKKFSENHFTEEQLYKTVNLIKEIANNKNRSITYENKKNKFM